MSSPTPSESPVAPSLAAELKRLEEIVRQLESPDNDLDRALVLFEEGVSRLRAARERLTEAEARVQQVLQGAAGEISLRDLDV